MYGAIPRKCASPGSKTSGNEDITLHMFCFTERKATGNPTIQLYNLEYKFIITNNDMTQT